MSTECVVDIEQTWRVIPVIWRELAKAVIGLDSTGISKEIINAAKYSALDWLGCAMAGAQNTVDLHRVLSGADKSGGSPGATLIGSNGRTTLVHAALANGIAGRSLGLFDSIEHSEIVVGAAVIPAALALAETHGRTGLDFLVAIIIGYEVAAYLGKVGSVSGCANYSDGKIESCAAAATGARILELDADATARALAMAWSLPVAPPALSGVLSACVAAEGLTKSRIGAGDVDAACPTMIAHPLRGGLSWGALGHRHVRLHAADVNTHAAIDAALALKMAYRLHPEDIEAIEVYTFSKAISGIAPETVQGLRQSIPYCLAMAFLRGRLGLNELSPQYLLKAPVSWLMANTTVQDDSEFSEAHLFPHGARVVVRTRYGRAYDHTVMTPRGSPENPASPAELEDKFMHLTKSILSPETASILSRRVLSISDLPNINSLFIDL